MYYKPPMFNPIIANAFLYWELERLRNRRKRAREIDQYFVYLSTFAEENYWFNKKLGGAINYIMNKMKIAKSEILKMKAIEDILVYILN